MGVVRKSLELGFWFFASFFYRFFYTTDTEIKILKTIYIRTRKQLLKYMMKNIFNHQLAPSSSLTESFVKARSLVSPIYRNNEAIAKYEAISLGPLMLKQAKKDLDRII